MHFCFDNYELDTEKFELRRDGEILHVEPQVFDFLQYLIEHTEKVVTREEIIENVWSGRIVSDTTISSCVKSARKILGDDGEHQKYIKTARGRGFQFIASFNPGIDRRIDDRAGQNKRISSQLSKPMTAYMIIAGLIFIIVLLVFNKTLKPSISNTPISASEFSIAVMPFVDLSAEGNQEYFGDGISEEVLNVLTAITELDVTSRTTAFSLKGQSLSVPEIAQRLNVNYIVEGSVRSSGNRIRITAQLIDTRTDSHLWSQNYDRELNDIFAIQDDISNQIATALQVELIGSKINNDIPTNNMEAYTLYLQGHQLFLNRGIGDLKQNINNIERAISYLEQAVTLDSNYAEAWADLASSNIILPSYFDNRYSFDRVVDRAEMAANKSISLRPTLSQAWAVKGFIHLNKLEFQQSEAAIIHSTDLNPNNETAWLWRGLHFLSVGNQNAAIEAINKAIEISPNVPIYHSALGMAEHAKGNIENAIPHMDKAINEMGFEAGRLDRALIAIWNNDPSRAIDEMTKFLTIYDHLSSDSISDKVTLYTEAYSDQSKKTIAEEQLAIDIAEGNENTYALYTLQNSNLFIDDFKTTAANKGFVLARIYNPIARLLFKEEEFRKFVKSTGLLEYWKNNSFPTFCQAIDNEDFSCD